MEFNNIYKGLIAGEDKLALVGLGYVGMPIAVEFAKHIKVIGFDINEKRVNEYRNGIDSTNEVGEAIKTTTVDFTADPTRLKEAKLSLLFRLLLTQIPHLICALLRALPVLLVRTLLLEVLLYSNPRCIPV